MKKINLIAPILASSAVVAAVVPMVSCGAKEYKLEFKEEGTDKYYYYNGEITFATNKKYKFTCSIGQNLPPSSTFGLYTPDGANDVMEDISVKDGGGADLHWHINTKKHVIEISDEVSSGVELQISFKYTGSKGVLEPKLIYKKD